MATAGLTLLVLQGSTRQDSLIEQFAFTAAFLSTSVVGALIVSRQPRNRIGWLFMATPGIAAVGFVLGEYAIYALVTRGGDIPAGHLAAALSDPLWIAAIGPYITFTLLLFPDGRLPSPRWRPVAWASAALIVVGMVVTLTAPTTFLGENPLAVETVAPVARFFTAVGFTLLVALAVLSVASLVLRYRRSRGDLRQQIRWLAFAAVLVGISLTFSVAIDLLRIRRVQVLDSVLGFVAFTSVPVGAGIAILKDRLYDIDVVIRRTVVYGALAAFMTAVYAAVVVGIGAAVAGSTSSTLLTMVAAVVIAITFQPVRSRVTRFANRLVYGDRATPYEVLSGFAERMSETFGAEDMLPRIARILGEGTGAERVDVWLRLSGEWRVAATWPTGLERISSIDGSTPDLAGADGVWPVRHQGEVLGALGVTKRRGEALTPAEEKLVADLASQVGLVLRNVRLTEELRAKVEELRASRQRIVSAQDGERRRLERNIHDGSQQQLVAMAVKLRLARSTAAKDPAKADALLSDLETEAQDALETLRDLARGIYPPRSRSPTTVWGSIRTRCRVERDSRTCPTGSRLSTGSSRSSRDRVRERG
jgi:signal transduction histidine kinase